ncbi:hypothetical protein Goari_022451, partial [Gossypium aridum]|nr:hypothetical protein [Gossypium aridum]
SGNGNHEKVNFTLDNTITLNNGSNNISLLSVTVGLPDSGAFLERKALGLRRVRIHDIQNSKDLSNHRWGYQVRFDAPTKNESFGLNLGSMGKGEVWINGQSIGRYWVSFLTSQGSPYQTWYHVPRSFLKPKDNLLVILEEQNGSPLGISLDIISTI